MMKGFKSIGMVLTTTLLGCGAGTASDQAAADAPGYATRASAAVSGKKRIVNPPVTGESACSALYSSPQAQAALSQAVVDPRIQANGAVRTLILSFNEDAAIPAALSRLTGSLGLVVGQNLGALRELPMVAISLPVTPSVLNTLKQLLQPLGLVSIYDNRPLRYYLDASVSYIHADTARTAFQTSGEGVGVGIIDSGIDATQGDFPNVVKNVKVVGSVLGTPLGGALYLDTPNSDLTSGHGTHVASTVGGSGARSNGLHKGVAPGARLVGVGVGDAINILFALEGFDFLMDPDVRETYNVRVISNSWGTSGSHFAPFDPISIASKRAYDQNMVVAFAAGNDGPGPDTLNPYSASPCVISVAAGTSRDTLGATNPLLSQDAPGELADFSSRGIPGDALHSPDITLPGVNIVAARATTALPAIAPPYLGLNGLSPEPFYTAMSGTSMATPHLSGVVALMLSVNPALNMDGVLAALTSTARPMFVTEANGSTRQLAQWEAGAGYADAYQAVRLAASTAGTRYTTSTTALPGWTGNVSASVVLPIGGVLLQTEHNYNLAVPAGRSTLRIKTDWGNPAYDLDLSVYAPNGNLVASSGAAVSASESVAIPNPVAGTYRVQLRGYLNGPTRYTGTAEVDQLIPIP